jgi:hypothetical protein
MVVRGKFTNSPPSNLCAMMLDSMTCPGIFSGSSRVSCSVVSSFEISVQVSYIEEFGMDTSEHDSLSESEIYSVSESELKDLWRTKQNLNLKKFD